MIYLLIKKINSFSIALKYLLLRFGNKKLNNQEILLSIKITLGLKT